MRLGDIQSCRAEAADSIGMTLARRLGSDRGMLLEHEAFGKFMRSALVRTLLLPGAFYGGARSGLDLSAGQLYYQNAECVEDYRTDPRLQAEITVNVTPRSIAFRSATGSSEQSGRATRPGPRGTVFCSWLYTRCAQFLKVAGLSDPQRDELRAILTTALPKK